MNSFNAIGNLGRDNELKFSQSGTAILSNSLAIRRNFKDKQTGEYESDWVNLVLFGKTAENFSNFTHKGSKVGISGRIQSRSYENQQGNRVYVTECIVNDFTLIEKADQGQPNYQGNSSDQQNQSQPNNDISSRIDNLDQSYKWHQPDHEKIEGRQMNIPADDLPF